MSVLRYYLEVESHGTFSYLSVFLLGQAEFEALQPEALDSDVKMI